jgi:hypothetical protein
MSIVVQVGFPNGGSSGIQVDELPDFCPVCHANVHPIFLVGRSLSDAPFSTIDAAYQCTRSLCRSVFIGRYKGSGIGGTGQPYILTSLAPKTPQHATFSKEIEKVSPSFVEIYNQAMAAEALGLNQLVGMGLRKALEFLVKDFAISLATTDEEKENIRKKQLGPCITDHIKDEPVRKAAKRATWLANDETHYERRWEDKDITDVKQLVRLTVNAVENAILMKQYETEMPES